MVATARRRDDPRTHRLGKLDRYRTHAAGTTMDQNGFVHGQLGAAHQSFPDRPSNERQAGGLQMADVARLAGDQLDIGNVLFGIGAGAAEDFGRVVNLVAYVELAHIRPLLLHDA